MKIPQLTAADIVKNQRTEKGLDYERRRKEASRLMRDELRGRAPEDPKAQAFIGEAKAFVEEVRQIKAVSPGSVHSSTFLSNMSVQYANDEYIGERLVPVVPVDHRADEFATYSKRDRIGSYDDSIGARGDANEVEENRSSDNYSVKDRALQNFVSGETLENQDAVFDEMLDLTESVADNLALNREIRIATLLGTTSNYASSYSATLSGSDQWDSSAGGDPIKKIQDAIALLWNGKGQTDLMGWCSLDVFNVLVRHATILDLFKYTRAGLVTQQQLAGLFGLTDLLVGAARKDTANSGQTISTSRIWGKDFGVLRVARRPSKRSAHFASTFQMRNDPQTSQWFDPRKGKSGGHYVKIGLSDDHKVVANDTGFVYKSVIA